MTITVLEEPVHERRFSARIDGEELKRIVATAVAQAAGIDLDSPATSIKHVWIRVEDKGSAGFVPHAEVCIVVDQA